MNKGLQNLILSYFVVSFNDLTNYLKTGPTLFALHNTGLFDKDTSNYSTVYSISDNIDLILYQEVADYHTETTIYDNTDFRFGKFINNGDIGLGIEASSPIHYNDRSPSIGLGRLLSNPNRYNRPDLLTMYRILVKKYNSKLVKIVLTNLVKKLININLTNLTSLIHNYGQLCIEYRALNLETPVNLYSIDDCIFSTTFYGFKWPKILHIPNNDNAEQIYQALDNMASDITKLGNKILIAINKF